MHGLAGARLAVRTPRVDRALLPIHIVVGDTIYIGQRISSRLDGRHANRCADRQGLIAYRGKTETKILFQPERRLVVSMGANQQKLVAAKAHRQIIRTSTRRSTDAVRRSSSSPIS